MAWGYEIPGQWGFEINDIWWCLLSGVQSKSFNFRSEQINWVSYCEH